MMVVIQCAAKKRPDAGHLTLLDGKPVVFVADPELAPSNGACGYARPDDRSERGLSWREELLSYNNKPEDNPLSLYPAYQLYANPTYRRLVDRFGLEKVYILSAGWGLIRANFLTPYYDITFSQSAERYKRRREADRYKDFSMLPGDTDEHIVFFGGKDYVPLFCSLTRTANGKRTVYYNATQPPKAPGCVLERFKTSTRTNWHYECANRVLDAERNQ